MLQTEHMFLLSPISAVLIISTDSHCSISTLANHSGREFLFINL